MFKFCEEIAQVPQPELSLIGALSLASVVPVVVFIEPI